MTTQSVTKFAWTILTLPLWLLAWPANAEPFALGYDVEQLAVISAPRGIDFLGDDLIVVSGNQLVQINPAGVQTTLAVLPGNGHWIDPERNPVTGSIYVSHYSGHAVYEVVDGVVSWMATVAGAAGLTISEDGKTLFVSSYTQHKILTIDTETFEVADCADVGTSPDGHALLNGDLYVASRGHHAIYRVEEGCGAATLFAQGGLNGPMDVVSDDQGLLVANFDGGTVSRVGLDGQVSDFAAGFQGPVNLVFDANDDLVAAAYYGNKLWVIRESNVRGTISGLTAPITVYCSNLTSGQEVVIDLGPGERSYDCTLAGFVVSVGDLVKVTLEASPADKDSAPSNLEFTYVPRYGTHENLEGRAFVEDPENYAVATYIKVNGGWWTKPYWAWPTVPILPDGTFVVDITTGGIDHLAREIVSYLIPHDHNPELRGGQPTLPALLEDKDAGVARGRASAAR